MLLALTLSASLLTAPSPVPSFMRGPTDPPIRLKLSSDELRLGEHARVRVRTESDGYLLVLRMDGEGRVRVLFPLDPDDSTTIKGGKDYEVKSRGDREAFMVDESTGVGTVLAVLSPEPFDFSSFVRGRHWDYRALEDSIDIKDAEASLLDIVDRVAPARYEYDVVRYTVLDGRNYPTHARYYGPSYYGPAFYDPWYHPFSGFWGPRFGFGIGFGFGGHPYRRHRSWW